MAGAKGEDLVTRGMCDERNEQLLGAMQDMKGEMAGLNKRLYHDNGVESIQTKLVKGAQRMAEIEKMLGRFQTIAWSLALGVAVQVVLSVLQTVGLIGKK